MYFKIEKSGCCEHKGLVQVRADFYYDETDKGYSLTEVKIFSKEGYQGKVDGVLNTPADMEDYKKWVDSLPTEKRLLPRHTHFIYFPHNVTNEEILFCFEIALDWYKKSRPMKNVKPVFTSYTKINSEIKLSEVISADFTKISNLYSVK